MILAQIACHENQLPQGSPCSPPISNLIANILDMRLNKLATHCRCTYTRYADDITFSTNERNFPERIAVRNGSPHEWIPSEELISRITTAGFLINHDKTRMQYQDSRQDTTGLIVNRKINVPVEYYKLTRAMCHRLFTQGEAQLKVGELYVPVEQDTLRGRLSFIYFVCNKASVDTNVNNSHRPNYIKLYTSFLNYTSFLGIKQPTIICEGKTDTIYIRSALRSLKPKFPAFLAWLTEKSG